MAKRRPTTHDAATLPSLEVNTLLTRHPKGLTLGDRALHRNQFDLRVAKALTHAVCELVPV
jgi:hypothetical protein